MYYIYDIKYPINAFTLYYNIIINITSYILEWAFSNTSCICNSPNTCTVIIMYMDKVTKLLPSYDTVVLHYLSQACLLEYIICLPLYYNFYANTILQPLPVSPIESYAMPSISLYQTRYATAVYSVHSAVYLCIRDIHVGLHFHISLLSLVLKCIPLVHIVLVIHLSYF